MHSVIFTTNFMKKNTIGDEKNTSQGRTEDKKKKASYKEEFSLHGDSLIDKLKELLKEGNIRRITIKNKEGKVLLEFPLTIGAVGVLLLPFWSAVAAIAALTCQLTLSVERKEE